MANKIIEAKTIDDLDKIFDLNCYNKNTLGSLGMFTLGEKRDSLKSFQKQYINNFFDKNN